MNFKIKSKLSEKQMEKDFSNYLGYISALSGRQFRLIDVNEQETGSDGLLNIGNAILPMYIQFKVSEGIEIAERIVPDRYSVIKRIHDFRTSEGLNDDPILYFKLRDLAKNADDYQHNVLLRHNGPRSLAFYLAPLTTSADSFYQSLVSSHDFFFWHHWREIRSHNLRHMIQLTPGLKNCVSITPHGQVDSSDHYYSYSTTGGNICFHSPEVISRDVSRFSDNFNRYLIMAVESGYESVGDIEDAHMTEIARKQEIEKRHSYRSYCKLLYEKHAICSYLLATDR